MTETTKFLSYFVKNIYIGNQERNPMGLKWFSFANIKVKSKVKFNK